VVLVTTLARMSLTSLGLGPALQDYLLRVSVREPEVQKRLREETAKLPNAGMQISPELGQLLVLLVELTGARRVVEIGTFTGYSALWMAQALPTGGKLVACDVSEEYTQVARRYWREAGVDDKVELHVRPALETLDALIAQGAGGSFDLAFIDADKGNYSNYYERVLVLLRSGGLAVFDNVLWGGAVADAANREESTRAIRALNERLADDARVSISLVPIGDGAFLARKR
jgi:predicted O-methyltransferase YrrM